MGEPRGRAALLARNAAWLRGASVTALCVGVASCAAVRGVPTIELPAEPPAVEARPLRASFRIGVYLSLSGPGSSRSLWIKEGISLAVDEIEPAIMARIARTAMIGGIKGEMFLGSDAWGSEELMREASEALEGAFFTDHWAPDAPWPASRTFVTRYKERFQRDPSTLAALSYDSAKIMGDAIERAPEGAPSAPREALREAIRGALDETGHFLGVTGAIALGASHDAEKSMVMRRIERGRPVYYTTLDPPARE